MAFWGVYVKPEEPYILNPDCEGRRLRITQATLGEQCEDELPRSVLQCAVGNNPPISVCSLSMKALHCFSLNLEFEEFEDVVFSVIGPRGVYLAGSYVARCASCCTTCDGANGFMIKYYDGKTCEEVENINDKKLNTTEDAENEEGKTFKIDDVENKEDKKLRTSEKDEDEKDRSRTTAEVAEKEKEKMLSATEEDIGDADSFADGSPRVSEENAYDISDSFIDDSGLSVQPSMQELLGVEAYKNVVENENPKDRKSSSKGQKRKLSTESDADNRSQQKQKTQSQQKRKTVEKLSSGVDGGADYNRGSGGSLVRGEKDKFNQSPVSGEPESGIDGCHHFKDTQSQRQKKKRKKTERKKEGFSGDIVIEELAKGKPDGKIAARRRKVKIMYTAWIKETGKVVDSNSGQGPFKFQLGDKEIIEGWNVGVEGMRVGDRRRLILPPSLGSWKTDESVIPPNSTLVYDIELIGVGR